MKITTVATPSLGDRTYVVTDGTAAVVVDPQRDIDRVLAAVDTDNLAVTHVLETHTHNDYVSGGLELSRVTGADYVIGVGEEMFFDHEVATDGDEFTSGALRIKAIHTPGHTPNHMSYLAVADDEQVVFTGGSLLYGSVGRTDLVSRAMADELTRRQFSSARRLASQLDDNVTVLPTHGFGSFCSSASSDLPSSEIDADMGVEVSTIGEQRRTNLALTITDEDEFVTMLLGGLEAYPRYYAHMGPRNRVGPGPIDLSAPVTADPDELAERIAAGEWVVDLRSRTAFAADHVVGTVNVEVGDSFITYLAWLVPWGVPITLVGDTAADVAEAQRQLTRVGIDRPAAGAVGGIDTYGGGLLRASYRVADFAGYAEAARTGSPHVLDVRRHDEVARCAIAGSQHMPIHEIEQRAAEIPTDQPVWVHCASGFRASIASSLVARRGGQVVLIDDEDDKLPALGVPLLGQ